MNPVAIEPIISKAGMDCGVSALAMYLGLPYRTVVDAALLEVPDVTNIGMTRIEMERIAARLGYDLIRTRKFNVEDDAGILFLQKGKRWSHYVVVFEGVVINPTDGLVWNYDAYIAKTHLKPITLLRLDN